MGQIILIGSPRNGTNVFRRMVMSSGIVKDFGEVFYPDLEKPNNFFGWMHRNCPCHPIDYSTKWREFLDSFRDGCLPLVDIKTNQLRFCPDFCHGRAWPIFPIVSGVPTRVIRIKRRNVLAQIISSEILVMTRQQRALPDAEIMTKKIRLDPALILPRIQRLVEQNQEVDQIVKRPDATFFYDDMFMDDGRFNPTIIARTARLLEISKSSLSAQPAYQKIGKGRRIENLEEVALVLTGTPHAWMVNDL